MKNEAAKKKSPTDKVILLDPDRKSPRAAEFEDKLSQRIVGQERAVRRMSGLFQIYLAGMNNPSRPIGTMLFLGPTGSGKTRVVEAASEVLFGEPHAVVKIDCAEFQHSHEIAKLIGSPPGYLGHRETSPMLTQENLDKAHTDDTKLTFVLFDEIEKASDSLWQLLLGILDKATLTLGDNRRVDFSKAIVIMTSNLGAREMSDMISGGIGFAPTKSDKPREDTEIDTKIYRTALEAAKRKFSPEFMNRIDKVVVFRSLKEHHLRRILDIELNDVQQRITDSAGTKFIFECTEGAKEFLLMEGIDLKYGARHLKRSIERFLVYPLSNLVATQQVETGDFVMVDLDEEKNVLIFTKQSGKMIVADAGPIEEPSSDLSKSDAVGAPLPQAEAGTGMSKSKGENNDV
ncbi:MAG: ATP-dependent Clp protease ATP-binding subunit [Acidobacteria bacterium]|nr:ATP-dependent Clp protease ATP-binding subunit [Acidobacteriota bacterium]